MNERRFSGRVERLRAPQRLQLLEVERVVAASLEAVPAHSILDVGCGSGVFAECFAAHGLHAAGVDINPEMVAAAAALVPGVGFQVASMERLPYPDQSFDLVFLGTVLHEADDLLEALREARRVAMHRVAVLEWPYREQEHGPPLAHRLPATQIQQLAVEVGLVRTCQVALQHLALYLLEPA